MALFLVYNAMFHVVFSREGGVGPIYIYIYIYISATALCAFGVTGFLTLLSDFCYPVLSAFLLIGPPPNPDGHEPETPGRVPSPPWAAFEKPCFCYKSLLIYTISLSGSII